MVEMTTKERETTRLGPARVRIGLLDESGKRTYYLVESHIDGWAPKRIVFGGKNVYTVKTAETNRRGEVVESLRIFDSAVKPTIIVDYVNWYDEVIDAERMTLDEYLETV